jgi:hypothetical protein
VARQMLTYVVGRGFADDSGLAWSAHIAELGHTAGGSFGALLTSVVQSDLFTKRRGEAP